MDREDLEDVPIIGELVAGVALLLDVVLHSGELVLGLGAALVHLTLGNVESLIPLLSVLNRLAGRVPWLPSELLSDVVTVALAVMVVLYAGRLLSKLVKNHAK